MGYTLAQQETLDHLLHDYGDEQVEHWLDKDSHNGYPYLGVRVAFEPGGAYSVAYFDRSGQIAGDWQ